MKIMGLPILTDPFCFRHLPHPSCLSCVASSRRREAARGDLTRATGYQRSRSSDLIDLRRIIPVRVSVVPLKGVCTLCLAVSLSQTLSPSLTSQTTGNGIWVVIIRLRIKRNCRLFLYIYSSVKMNAVSMLKKKKVWQLAVKLD